MTHKDILDRRRPIIESCSDCFEKLCRWMPEFLTEVVAPSISFQPQRKIAQLKIWKEWMPRFWLHWAKTEPSSQWRAFWFWHGQSCYKSYCFKLPMSYFSGFKCHPLTKQLWRWFSGAPRFEPGQLVQMRECYLSAMPSPIMPTRLIETFGTIGSISSRIDTIINQLYKTWF